MDPTIDDYQGSALFGNAPNNAQINATMLNPAAAGPDDWTTILTNGISGAAVNGINGMINNAIVKGQLQNASAATSLTVKSTGLNSANMMPLLVIGVLLLLVTR